MILILKLVSI